MEKKTKINFFDIVVLLVIIASVSFGAFKLFFASDNSAEQQIKITFTTKEVSDFVVDKVEIGCRMYDDNNKTDLGTLEDKTVSDSLSSIVTDSGEWTITDKPDYSSMVLTSIANGKKLDNGVDIGGHTYFLGDFVVLRAGVAKVYIEITKIEIIE